MESDTMLPESRPLLPNESTTEPSQSQPLPKKPTPLPWLQLANALLVEFCAALEQQSILPYINQLISELDVVQGDKRKIGYYLGLLGSLRSVTNTLTTLPLSRLSDRIGRKPVMLSGMIASTVSMLCFGLSRTFFGLLMRSVVIMIRACIGAMNTNTVLVKIVVGGITDSTNRARGFSWVLMLWSVGGSISSLIGGGLSKPSGRFPGAFDGKFWKQHPYFLPCLTIAIFTILSIVFVLFCFEETLPRRSTLSQDLGNSLSNRDRFPSIWRILTYRITIAVANYAMFDALFTCEDVLISLFFAMPIELGGLNFNPATIGYILSGYRAFTAFFLIICCPRIVHHLGGRQAFRLAIYSTMVAWVVIGNANDQSLGSPFRHHDVSMGLRPLSGLSRCALDDGYSCIYLTAAAPSHDTLGAVNGLARTGAAIGNGIAPLIATSLFSLSVEYNICGGYAVYIALFTMSCFVVWLTTKLHHDTRPSWDGDGFGR